MKFILGKKLYMSQIFSEEGRVIPVTVIRSGPCFVTHVKTDEKDGYTAVQVGFQEKKKVVKPLLGHLKGRGLAYVREVRVSAEHAGAFTVGDTLEASMFELGDIVDVIGTSKGKGFQGVVKRHGFAGQKATHGNKDQSRSPGSIGSTGPQRVFKGRKMAGRMGAQRVTIKNLKIVKINSETSEIYVKGAVPGVRNSLLMIIRE
ncbi:MAG: 50S ribosomal protein L3 [Parcubacteria group bacterium GW2011_GWA2_44_12]|nr:MAG: 50S ribosomal protein L3 [Parcubacteria group bacterium GW2011_GWA2_44_12]